MRRALTAFALTCAVLAVAQCTGGGAMIERFDRPDGLVTNEWATAHPDAAEAVLADDWLVTSGSLFADDGAGWTGPIDALAPGPTSEEHTNSAVLRALTERDDFDDVLVTMDVRHDGFVATDGRPEQDYDGLHLALRWQDPATTYYVSVYRRDGAVAVKKKSAGGDDPVNGGTYTTLARGESEVPRGWTQVSAEAITKEDGTVVIRLAIGGRTVLEAVDDGRSGPPITEPGRVGIRADNTELHLDDLAVQPNDVDHLPA